MSFGQAVKHVFGNYASFQGRASRSEFWWFYLFMVIVNFVLSSIYFIGILTSPKVETSPGVYEITSLSPLAIIGIVVLIIWGLATIIPVISVSVRRLHDTDRSGWWWWLNLLLICAIGPIILLVFYILPGTPGPNRFGEGPATAA